MLADVESMLSKIGPIGPGPMMVGPIGPGPIGFGPIGPGPMGFGPKTAAVNGPEIRAAIEAAELAR
jgi:hypothetical protein